MDEHNANNAPQTVTAYLRVRGATEAIEFYKRAFGAQELFRLQDPGGRIGHAELKIGNTTIMLADEFPEMNVRGPQSLGGTSVGLALHVAHVDATTSAAAAAGATIVNPPADQFYGERTSKLVDPFGHEWHISTTIEAVSADEMQKRYSELAK
jgi:PhnB protein